MTLTPRLVAEIIRQRLNLPDDSQAARIINMIPQALKATGRKIAADPDLRQLLISDKVTALLPISTGGAVALSTGYSSWRFLLEYFDLGLCYFLVKAEVPSTSAVSDTITIGSDLTLFADLVRVQFSVSSGGTLPGGISAATDYYLINYDSVTGIAQLSDLADGSGLVNIGVAATGTLYIQKMDVTVEQSLQRLKSPQQVNLDRYLSAVFNYFQIQGDVLQVLPNTLQGQVAFAVPTYPTNLAAMPDSEEAERIFLDKIYELVLAPVNDAAQDGEK